MFTPIVITPAGKKYGLPCARREQAETALSTLINDHIKAMSRKSLEHDTVINDGEIQIGPYTFRVEAGSAPL